MLKAVFYSDQIIGENAKVDARLIEILGRQGNRIGYVPSGPDPDLRYFRAQKTYYSQYGLELAVFYDLDAEVERAKIEALLSCDAIHLSGGDTTAFLRRLRRSGMLNLLRDWARGGGTLIGVSAGAILMTPTIAVDALFKGMRPGNGEDQGALDLVPFEFFPHAQKGRYLEDLLAYSRSTPRPIAACSDGDGVIVLGEAIECMGNVTWLFQGKHGLVEPRSLSEVGALMRPHQNQPPNLGQ